MPSDAGFKITKTSVDAAASREKEYVLFDDELTGFGLRVYPSGRKSYVVKMRAPEGGRAAKQSLITLGRHGVLTPAQARTRAAELLSGVRLGQDPVAAKRAAREDPTVRELVEQYLDEACGAKSESTLRSDRSRISAHILPLLGDRRQATITARDILRFRDDVAAGKTAQRVMLAPRKLSNIRGGKGAATRTMGLLGGIFTFAKDVLKIRNDNPVLEVERFKDRVTGTYLGADDLAKLSIVFAQRDEAGITKTGLSVIRLLLLTGARRDEIEGLAWHMIDLPRSQLRLTKSKELGPVIKTIYLPPDAVQVLKEMKPGEPADYVFPSEGGTGHYTYTDGLLVTLCKHAGVPAVRVHDLRHSFASFAAQATGGDLLRVGSLLGHKDIRTTRRYVHFAENAVSAAAEATGKSISAALSGK